MASAGFKAWFRQAIITLVGLTNDKLILRVLGGGGKVNPLGYLWTFSVIKLNFRKSFINVLLLLWNLTLSIRKKACFEYK